MHSSVPTHLLHGLNRMCSRSHETWKRKARSHFLPFLLHQLLKWKTEEKRQRQRDRQRCTCIVRFAALFGQNCALGMKTMFCGKLGFFFVGDCRSVCIELQRIFGCEVMRPNTSGAELGGEAKSREPKTRKRSTNQQTPSIILLTCSSSFLVWHRRPFQHPNGGLSKRCDHTQQEPSQPQSSEHRSCRHRGRETDQQENEKQALT